MMSNREPIEPVREAHTPAEMRAEIARLRWDDQLVRACMDAADYSGASSEDRYTMLAYHALATKAEAQRKLFECLLLNPAYGIPVLGDTKLD